MTEDRSVYGADAKFDPFYGDGFIAIDALTYHSGQKNVIVIDDEFIDNKNNIKRGENNANFQENVR
jgi:hypothetical protein